MSARKWGANYKNVLINFNIYCYYTQGRGNLFLDLLLETAKRGTELSESDILSQVDTFMFAVSFTLLN
jgi:hypothetical protein